MRICTGCKQTKDDSEFHKSGKYYRSKCNICQKQYADNYNHNYTILNRETLNKKAKFYRENIRNINKEIRLKFLLMYGNKCECCGESIQEFLAVDHIKGSKRTRKDEIGGYKSYKNAVDKYDPTEYRILCHNCNQATKGGKICPHKK